MTSYIEVDAALAAWDAAHADLHDAIQRRNPKTPSDQIGALKITTDASRDPALDKLFDRVGQAWRNAQIVRAAYWRERGLI